MDDFVCKFKFLLKSNQIKEIFKRANTNDVFYSYWGKCSNVLSVVYHGRAHFVSRYHGEWDLWEESSGNYVPLREREAACLDYAVFISHKGEEYYRSKYPQSKTVVYPLGSKDYGIQKEAEDKDSIRVVSCSTVYPLKRVDLILMLLILLRGKKLNGLIWVEGKNLTNWLLKLSQNANHILQLIL